MLRPPSFQFTSKWFQVAIINFWPDTWRLGIEIHWLRNSGLGCSFPEVVFPFFAVVEQGMWNIIDLELVFAAHANRVSISSAERLNVVLKKLNSLIYRDESESVVQLSH